MSSPDIKAVSQINNEQLIETSPLSSHTSSPDSQRRGSRHDSVGSSMSGGSSNTPQTNFLQKQKELREQQLQQQQLQRASSVSSQSQSPQSPQSPQNPQSPQSPQHPQSINNNNNMYTPDKPPIPPRGVPPAVSVRQLSSDAVTVTLRTRTGTT